MGTGEKLIRSVTQAGMKEEYGIRCQRFFPTEARPTPFGSSWCEIPPGGATAPHHHHEGETFFLLSGAGEMRIDGAVSKVNAGDVVLLPPHSQHVLVNGSVVDPLTFVSVWWEGTSAAAEPLPAHSFVSVAPPTPNGGLHLGHLSGPYVASDVYVRFLKQRGVATFFMSGSDDNQSYVPAKGEQLGLAPEEVVDRFAASIEGTLESAEVQLDRFVRPTRTPEYVEYVQGFVRTLHQKGALVAREVDEPYCGECRQFLHEAWIAGLCPHCAQPTAGHGCEGCGIPNDARDLRESRCRRCGGAVSRRAVRKLFFPLEPYREKLAAFHREVKMPARLKALTAGLHAKGFPELSASFVSDWGIPVPIAGFEGQVIYEWIEMAAGYRWMAESRGDANPFRRGNGSELVQAFGFDNAFFYTTFHPALYLAHDPDTALPRAFLVNEFYRLDGRKFSTSRNHAIWGDEMLARVPVDVVRFYLAYSRPEDVETNFTLGEFAAVVRRELVDSWESWLATLAERQETVAPEVSFSAPSHRRFHTQLVALAREAEGHYRADGFSPAEVTRVLSRLVRAADRFRRAEAWREAAGDESGSRSALGLELAAAKALAMISAPLMPRFAAKLGEALGMRRIPWDVDVAPLPAGTLLGRLPVGSFSRSVHAIETMEKERHGH